MSAPVTPERVLVRPIHEAEAREVAVEIGNAVQLHDLNDEETETLIAVTIQTVTGSISHWKSDGLLRDLFLSARHRKEKAKESANG